MVTGTPHIPTSLPPSPLPHSTKRISYRLNIAFFLFGLLNNSLYVVILTAALELLPQGVPTGLVSFANIFPALIAKAVWPYVLRGEVRYAKRVWSCAGLSFVGMLLVSFFPKLGMRLLGISLASFSSGLGELTFLQLSTRYAPKAQEKRLGGVPVAAVAGAGLETNFAGDAVGWFASGTGAAGLVGAAAWWVVRPLGVQTGMAILSVLPGFMVLAYVVVLPSVEQLLGGGGGKSAAEYAPVATEDDANGRGSLDDAGEADETADNGDDEDDAEVPTATPNFRVRLTFQEKMSLLRPMLLPYIIPLVIVYAMEYTINQGIAPTLIYPLPTRETHPLLSLIVKKLTDYYPLYQLVYQTFVFLSRSSISIFKLPPIPRRWLWAPAVLQTGLLAVLMTESLFAWFRSSIASPLVIVLICVEGLAGGGAYVSVFYSIGVDARGEEKNVIALPRAEEEGNGESAEDQAYRLAKKAQEHEFRIGCVGFGDSLGILAASLISMPLQVSLCNSQVRSGRDLCKQT
ncbi:hypothetical protein EX895_000307 [Sporisorium graminicola]|uniref:Protein BTN n=1 Tax=Sporisorium graminicola TaxID=280036 RepID=A0A4V6EW58_9BASI|nr:hypothetical protein EX895_000307 [Sporisorium graminicola]TKY90309.1 hypothetical protein EX895_000307 [Sporisorium graminicola]